MVQAIGREVHGTSRLRILDLDILRPMGFAPGAAREVSILWQDADRAVEIRSRPRLDATSSFILHARAVVLPETAAAPEADLPPGPGVAADEAAIYAATERCRMGYTGAFRAAHAARVHGDTVVVDLAPQPADLGAFADVQIIDPPLYDAAVHGIFLSVGQSPGQVVGELPVRVERLSLFRPGAPVARSVARLLRQGRDARVFDIALLSATDEVVGQVRGVVMRRLVLAAWREADRIVDTRLTRWEAGPRDLSAALAAALSKPLSDASGTIEPRAALIGLGLDIAADVVHRLGGPRIAIQEPGLGAGIAPGAEVVWAALLQALSDSGRMREDADGVLLTIPPPDAATGLLAFARQHPEASADLRLALHALDGLPRLLRGEGDAPPPPDLTDALDSASLLSAPSLDALAEALERLIAAAATDRLRVLLLDPGLGGLLQRVLPRLRSGEISLAVLSADGPEAERVVARQRGGGAVPILGPEQVRDAGPFDLALCAGVTPLDGGEPSPLDLLASLGAKAPPLLAVIPPHDPAIDVLHAAMPGWFRFSPGPRSPVGAWPYPSEAEEALTSRRFRILASAVQDGSGARLVAAEPPRRHPPDTAPPRSALCLALADPGDDTPLGALLPGFVLNIAVSVDDVAALAAATPLPEGFAAVLEVGPRGVADEVARLTARMLRLRDLAVALGDGEAPCRLYMVIEEAEGAASHALAAYGRCLMNEFPRLDICLLRLASGATAASLEPALRRHLAEPLRERELRVGATGAEVPRAARRAPPALRAPAEGERSVLRVGPRGLEDLGWVIGPRAAPGAGEVEIAVAATGLNYRDVMLGLGVLDSEILGAGATAGSLGFEVSGTVLRVGAGVEALRVGDRVMGFAAGAFASHLTLPATQLFPLADGLPTEAGAAIPVAFLTAWYGLVERARLGAGETVLVPGAAGGVGLAALQIARQCGAVVVAAAGTAEKRALLRRLGADVVVDSRAPDLDDVIRAAVGGVDVVLNSVAGGAMRAALRLLRPFGRFVELGKRDFLDNTRLGLRPFLHNVSYLGADIDQLLAHDPAAIRRMIGTLTTMFEAGRLAPLPSLALPGERAADAFRLMQASGHVGKILVRPALRAQPEPPAAAEFVPAPGVHVVLGGTGGFGLETALWLAERGARCVVLASRRGVVGPEHAERLARLRALGCLLREERLDVTDGAAVAAAFAGWRTALGPIAGIIHCAMVLEDGVILGLTPEKIGRVLEPKIRGMRAIEAALGGETLQYLVAYSSSTTFVGSPGQSSYVVGNAFLEGAVVALRARGVPALAVAWGAISDVGVIARTAGLADRLRQATGVSGVTSAEALRHLGGLLADPMATPPVSAYSVIRWVPAASKLAVLRSPYFAEVFSDTGQAEARDGGEALDLSALGRDEAAEVLLGLIRDEVARILRLPADAVEVDRPLMDLGLDSLMALELRLGLEKRTGQEMAMTMMTGGLSVRSLAGRIAATLAPGST
jgi:NADPH:quinone reductase-like Zn-dependent oxidoreductase/acyl carrier protein